MDFAARKKKASTKGKKEKKTLRFSGLKFFIHLTYVCKERGGVIYRKQNSMPGDEYEEMMKINM